MKIFSFEFEFEPFEETFKKIFFIKLNTGFQRIKLKILIFVIKVYRLS